MSSHSPSRLSLAPSLPLPSLSPSLSLSLSVSVTTAHHAPLSTIHFTSISTYCSPLCLPRHLPGQMMRLDDLGFSSLHASHRRHCLCCLRRLSRWLMPKMMRRDKLMPFA